MTGADAVATATVAPARISLKRIKDRMPINDGLRIAD
jgi:hypothetical protein